MEDKLKVWIARDKDGVLFVYSSAPFKRECIWSPQSPNINSMELKSDKFPTVKWEDDEPTEAYITLAEQQEQPKPKQEIDWEKRRYEIAKEIMPLFCRQGIELMKCWQDVEWKDIVDGAVNFTDMLIEKLKKGE